mmetsp:Transcript_14034/g.35434  ORF Transcript_14034/g.35434 Transcript_14034/m.35434 type:complete len:245 (-) Transcript_14034:3-737(-)
MGRATSSLATRPNISSTSSRANSNAVPGPWLVTTFPSTTVRPLKVPLKDIDVASCLWKSGWHVALLPSSRPMSRNTTAGAAHIAPSKPSLASCFSISWQSASLSLKRFVPGIPPGRTTASNSAVSSTTSLIVASATIRTPLEHVTALDSSTDAMMTDAPALRSTSTRTTASISSVPVATGTSTLFWLFFCAAAAALDLCVAPCHLLRHVARKGEGGGAGAAWSALRAGRAAGKDAMAPPARPTS